jgi:hypothetical protein
MAQHVRHRHAVQIKRSTCPSARSMLDRRQIAGRIISVLGDEALIRPRAVRSADRGRDTSAMKAALSSSDNEVIAEGAVDNSARDQDRAARCDIDLSSAPRPAVA